MADFPRMDGRQEYIIPPLPENRSNLRKRIPSTPNYGVPDKGDDGRQFLINKELENRTDLSRTDERDGFYCGDAIMFYPDAPDCNGSAQQSKKPVKNKTKGEQKEAGQNKPHKCIQCGAAFKQRSHLTAHIRTHTGEKPFSCNICGKTFSRNDSALRHMKTHGPKESKAKAAEKALTFSTPIDSIPAPQFNPLLKSLPPSFNTAIKLKPKKEKKKKRSKGEKHRHHKRRSREGKHKCANCGQSFRQLCHLRVHVRIHTGEKPYSCEVCGKTFGRKFSAARHLKVHGGGKLITINQNAIPPAPTLIPQQVPSTSGSMGELLPRLTRTERNDKPFHCNQCTAAFSQQSHLRNHLRTHSGEKPFSCETCGRTFSRKYSALRHMRTHTGEKKYKCDFCGNLYSHRFHLRDHMRTHTGEKPFNCPVCEKAFCRKDLAVRHLRTHTDTTDELFDFPEESD